MVSNAPSAFFAKGRYRTRNHQCRFFHVEVPTFVCPPDAVPHSGRGVAYNHKIQNRKPQATKMLGVWTLSTATVRDYVLDNMMLDTSVIKIWCKNSNIFLLVSMLAIWWYQVHGSWWVVMTENQSSRVWFPGWERSVYLQLFLDGIRGSTYAKQYQATFLSHLFASFSFRLLDVQ